MGLSFRDLAPGAEPWIRSLSETPPVQKAIESVWIFAVIETLHLFSLAVIGGAVLSLALRLLGLVLAGEAATDVERRVRPWLHFGVVGALATGAAMGVMNAATLFPSSAFFVKMVALVAAILFSYAVVGEVVRKREAPSPVAIAATIAALTIWAYSLFLFVTTPRVNPGAVLILVAGAGLLAAATRRFRALLVSGLGVILFVGWCVTQGAPPQGADAAAAWTSIGFVVASAAFVLGVGALEIRAEAAEAPARLVAFASTLAWVTVAAAGRWIGFS